MGLISRKLCRFLLMFSTGFTSVSYFFFLFQSPSSALCMVFDSTSSNIDEVLSINPSANVFVFGDFDVHHKDWLIYSGGTDQPGELGSQTVILKILLFWIYFLHLMLVFVLQWLSLHWEILIMLLSQFPWTFQLIHNGMPHFIAQLMTILVLIRMVFVII